MDHVFKQPRDCTCGGDTGTCPICDGGLAWCKACGQAEGELTPECPGSVEYRFLKHLNECQTPGECPTCKKCEEELRNDDFGRLIAEALAGR